MQNGAAAVHSLRPVTLSSQSSDTILYRPKSTETSPPVTVLLHSSFSHSQRKGTSESKLAKRERERDGWLQTVLLRQVKNGRRIERKESDRTDRVRGRGVGESERERERKHGYKGGNERRKA